MAKIKYLHSATCRSVYRKLLDVCCRTALRFTDELYSPTTGKQLFKY